MSLSSLIISLHILSTRFYLFIYYIFLASLHIFFLSILKIYIFSSSTGFIIVSLHNLNTKHKATLTLPKGITIYKPLIFILDFSHYNHIYKKKLCKYCVLLRNMIMTLKKGVSCKDGWLPKRKRVTNKNVTKISVNIKGVYCIGFVIIVDLI